MTQDLKQERDRQQDRQLTASAQQMSMQAAQKQQEKTLQNEYFLNELRDADIDSELFEWLTDEYPTLFSGAHAVGNRDDTWDREADLKNFNKRERLKAEGSPGRLLQDRPRLHAIAQGCNTPQDEDYRAPLTPREERAIDGAVEVSADLMSLSKDRAGLDATTTATTENRVKRESNEESSSKKLSDKIYG